MSVPNDPQIHVCIYTDAGDSVGSLGREHSLEREMATHSSSCLDVTTDSEGLLRQVITGQGMRGGAGVVGTGLRSLWAQIPHREMAALTPLIQ